jgi:hypothetical protein
MRHQRWRFHHIAINKGLFVSQYQGALGLEASFPCAARRLLPMALVPLLRWRFG